MAKKNCRHSTFLYIFTTSVSTVTSGSQVIRVVPCQIFKISTCLSKKERFAKGKKTQNVLIFLPENLHLSSCFFFNSSATAHII